MSYICTYVRVVLFVLVIPRDKGDHILLSNLLFSHPNIFRCRSRTHLLFLCSFLLTFLLSLVGDTMWVLIFFITSSLFLLFFLHPWPSQSLSPQYLSSLILPFNFQQLIKDFNHLLFKDFVGVKFINWVPIFSSCHMYVNFSVFRVLCASSLLFFIITFISILIYLPSFFSYSLFFLSSFKLFPFNFFNSGEPGLISCSSGAWQVWGAPSVKASNWVFNIRVTQDWLLILICLSLSFVHLYLTQSHWC